MTRHRVRRIEIALIGFLVGTLVGGWFVLALAVAGRA